MFDCDNREPLIFSAGDTLYFKRYLPDYTPANGWSLEYAITGGVQGDTPVTFASAADGDFHKISVPMETTAAWLPGYYVLTGYATNGTYRHQIYYNQFQVTPNAEAVPPAQPVTTHYQRMIVAIEAALEKLAEHSIDESDIEQTRINRVKRIDLEMQLARNKELRANEIAAENVANGRPSGMKIRPFLCIMPTGGPFYPGFGWPRD